MNNTPAQLCPFNVTTRGPCGNAGIALAAYDGEDARDTVEDFLGSSRPREFEPVMFLGLASDEIEHGMIMTHIPELV